MSRLTKEASRFKKIVLWGYRSKKHSHRYIHEGYYNFFQRKGINCLWVDDDDRSNDYIESGDLIMIPDVHLTINGNLRLHHRFRSDVFYILHPGDFLTEDQINSVSDDKLVKLYEHRRSYVDRFNLLTESSPFILIDRFNKILIQPWGANLDFVDFLAPVAPVLNNIYIYFIGSVWGDDEGLIRGNKKIIIDLGLEIDRLGLELKALSGLAEEDNINKVRASRVSISPGSIGHERDRYLQCRTFKNISYGQPTLTDILAFKELLGASFVDLNNWSDGICKIISLRPNEYSDLCLEQQYSIRNYTYECLWLNMFEMLS